MILCKECGASSEKSYSGKCQRCYFYFRKGGVVWQLPPSGEIVIDNEGKVICHICGRSFDKLGEHTFHVHGLTEKDYKEKFELNRSSSLASEKIRKKLRENVYNNYSVIQKNLIEGGKKTRVSSTNRIKLGKPDRLESINAKKGNTNWKKEVKHEDQRSMCQLSISKD